MVLQMRQRWRAELEGQREQRSSSCLRIRASSSWRARRRGRSAGSLSVFATPPLRSSAISRDTSSVCSAHAPAAARLLPSLPRPASNASARSRGLPRTPRPLCSAGACVAHSKAVCFFRCQIVGQGLAEIALPAVGGVRDETRASWPGARQADGAWRWWCWCGSAHDRCLLASGVGTHTSLFSWDSYSTREIRDLASHAMFAHGVLQRRPAFVARRPQGPVSDSGEHPGSSAAASQRQHRADGSPIMHDTRSGRDAPVWEVPGSIVTGACRLMGSAWQKAAESCHAASACRLQ